ncbi:SAF domain-containing protein [Kineosporia sp. NBRC 101731]|uniref:SAF domain-containing protein n=1 Tax=Kineosporia sp. NBRC 101731 TaxID=3032199 RepID=UPI0024A5233E|nr:SAF domain-containing protein [Kineosporia sp. NBRC 101731]GLY28418.1 flagellar protein FlgA [Kineosporia sp. NBRC 101731]
MVVSELVSTRTAPARLRRPGWRDPRLIVGLVLLFGSIAAGARLVAEAGQTRAVYAARGALPPGTALTAEVLRVVRVRVDGTGAGYLDADSPLPVGAVLVRTVGDGELIPMAAIGSAASLSVRPVVIPFDGPPPGGLAAGGRADIWAALPREEGRAGYQVPRQIASDVEVFAVTGPGTGLNSSRSGSLQVLVPEQKLTDVLEAVSGEARLSILPVLGTPRPVSRS